MSADYKATPIFVKKDDPAGLPCKEVEPVGDEIWLPKGSSNVFTSTNLDYLLRNMGATDIIIVVRPPPFTYKLFAS